MLDPSGFELSLIPNKRYFTIGEVSSLCGVKPHVLRYWEQEFTRLKPVKRRGNRRYYQRHEVELVRQIRHLLHVEGFTIIGARAQLEQLSAEQNEAAPDQKVDSDRDQLVSWITSELNDLKNILE